MKNTQKCARGTMTRRSLLQATCVGIFTGFAAPLVSDIVPAYATPKAFDGKKILIVYYSHTGNTRAVAQHIQAHAGGALVELQTLTPYPGEYKALTDQAKKELQTGYKPPLKTSIENIATYDLIFLGSPNWWGTIAAPLRTFLSDYDLSGKIVAPFMTHGGGGLGRTVADIKSLCPAAFVTDGLAVRGTKAATAQGDVAAWLRSIESHSVKP